MREALDRVARSVQVWSVAGGRAEPRSAVLEPDDGGGRVTALAALPAGDGHRPCLVCGDDAGGLRLWTGHAPESPGQDVRWECARLLQFRAPPDTEGQISVACLEPLPHRRLAVSFEVGAVPAGVGARRLAAGATALDVPRARAVVVVDVTRAAVAAVLDGHRDAVRCMCALPDGGLATGGGKLDATVRVWGPSQVRGGGGEGEEGGQEVDQGPALRVVSEGTTLEKVGYCFALKALPDATPGSRRFALAAARYNVVKICL